MACESHRLRNVSRYGLFLYEITNHQITSKYALNIFCFNFIYFDLFLYNNKSKVEKILFIVKFQLMLLLINLKANANENWFEGFF